MLHRRLMLGLALASVLGAAAHAQPNWVTVNVDLTDYKFTPSNIEFNAGQLYLLHLTNSSTKIHNFDAQAFFKTVKLEQKWAYQVKGGVVDVWPGRYADVFLTPQTPGTYELHSGVPMQQMLGMKGEITVH